MKRALTTLIATGLLVCVACRGTERVAPALSDATETSSNAVEQVSARVAVCDNAPQGTPCGKAGTHMHCIFQACVKNICGDGIVDDGEECDDDNQRSLDGCDEYCRREPLPGCGNGVVEPGEECDDGNVADDDQCTHACTTARCGDEIVSAGESCDDGNLNDHDDCSNRCRSQKVMAAAGGTLAGAAANGGGAAAPSPQGGAGDSSPDAGTVAMDAEVPDATAGELAGTSASDAAPFDTGPEPAPDSAQSGSGAAGNAGGESGAVAAGTGGSGATQAGSGGSGGSVGAPLMWSAECTACRDENCRDYQGSGIDFVAGCFDSVDVNNGAAASDPSFLADCTEAVRCAYQNRCGYDEMVGLAQCYCGTQTADLCANNGPAADAKCVDAVKTAARADTNEAVGTNLSVLMYPSGWAYFLLECDRTLCATTCTPQ